NGAYSNLGPGIYIVVITDVNGCTANSQLTIIEPSALTAVNTTTPSTCGNSNGSISVITAGGIAPYTYQANGVSNGSSNIISNLNQGAYSIIVTDQNGCTAATSSNVINVAGPTITTVAPTNVTCNGLNNGSINIVSLGGTNPILYSINNGSSTTTSPIFNNLTPGGYNILITDANGCTSASTAQITQPTALNLSSNSTSATCGQNNGIFNLIGNGGTPPYQYSGNGGTSFQPTGNFVAVGPGTYSVILSDFLGCTSSGSVSVANSAAPIVSSVPITNITCNGYNDGSATINVNGGALPLTYSINGGFTTTPNNSFNNLAPGPYSILVTDANGCTGTYSINITQPSAFSVTSTTSNASCGNNDGTATITGSGGSGGLTYSLNGGAAQTNGNFNNLGAGNYTVVVTDQSGCTASVVASVSNNAAPIISNLSGTDVNCFGNSNGTINISANGGTPPLNFSIDNGVTYQSSSTFPSLPGGVYSISVLDANGCIASSNITIAEPQQLTLSTLPVNSTCGSPNGSLSSLATGGSSPYSYSINNGSTFQATGSFSNLTSGLYSILVTDNNGCTSQSSSTIQNAGGPSLLSNTVSDVTCFGLSNGSITSNVSGGTAPLFYSVNGAAAQASNFFGGLSPGAYSIVVSDANGCTATSSSNISSPSQLILNPTSIGSTCNNPNGSINISATGGISNYSYSNNGGLTYQSSSAFNGLIAGPYNVMVMDANGCTSNGTVNVADAPGPIMGPVTAVNVNCYNGTTGSISTAISGGSAPFSYSLNQGSTQPSGVFNNLSAGSYNILVSDANGCTANTSQVLIQPSALLTSTSTSPSTCLNGTNGAANVTASGGTSPYSYQWSSGGSTSASANNLTAGTYAVTVTDNNGCTSALIATVSNIAGPTITNTLTSNSSCYQSGNGSVSVSINGGTGPFTYVLGGSTSQSIGTFSNLIAGPDTILVIDNNGCIALTSFFITEPAQLLLAGTSSDATCGNSNGTINLNGIGGTPPYNYSNNGGTTYQPSFSFSNLAPGNYGTAVMDANGCTTLSSTNIIDLAGPVLSSVNTNNPLCFGSNNGSITINASGSSSLTYSINNGTSSQVTSVFNGLGAGSYNILVTDTNGCIAFDNAALTEPDPLIGVATTNPSICNNGNNGDAFISVQGGVSPYSYSWSNGSISNSITNLTAGTYTISVSDANGCTMLQNAIVSNIAGPTIVSTTSTNNNCYQSNNGTASIQISSGTGPFTFNLNGTINQSNGVFTNLSAGTGNVLITDNNGCTAATSFLITEPAALNLSVSNTSTTCGSSNGVVNLNPSGGTAPYQYSNNNGSTYQSSNVFTNLIAGGYPISIIDANGCVLSQNIVLIDSPGPVVLSVSSTNVTCNGYTDGVIAIATTSGTAPLSYQINNGTPQLGSQFIALPAGTYNVLVTDANGCTATTSSTITQPQPLSISAAGQTTICIGQSATISAIGAGGNGGYVYTWSNGSSSITQNVSPGTSTNFTVSVTDSLGCPSAITNVAINVNPPLQLVITPNDTICEGQSSTIVALASGGDGGPYNYQWTGMASASSSQTVSP
ncbi:MAG: beta strand repeat-containing protein, partial [Bacteroidota bacterium]